MQQLLDPRVMGSMSLIARLSSEYCYKVPRRDLSLTDDGSHYVPDWICNDSGKTIQKRLWQEVSQMLDGIEPGCVNRALAVAR